MDKQERINVTGGEQRQMIGPYQVLEVIGHGGMSTVYKAFQPDLQRVVAIKVLLPAFANDAGFRLRFEREARVIARLRHPHIVGIYGIGDDEDLPFLVMEYLQGPTLHAALRERRRSGSTFTPAEVLGLLTPLASALDYAHAHDVIHRDLKPENIILTSSGPVITDFGLAKLVQEETATVSIVMGTPSYMAPEQIRGEDVDHRTDIYALGILLYELLTGDVPFSGSSPYAVAQAHLSQPAPPLRALDQRMPASPLLEEVVARAVAKSKADRWSSAGEMVSALSRAVDEVVTIQQPATVHTQPLAPARPILIGSPQRLRRPADTQQRTSRWLLAVPLLAVLLFALWGATVLARRSFTTNEPGETAVADAPRTASTITPREQPNGGGGGSVPENTPQPATPTIADEAVVPESPTPSLEPSPTAIEPTPTDTVSPTTTATNQVVAVVRSPVGANLRSGPGTFYDIIAGLPDGARITAFNRIDDWLDVEAETGERGWIATTLIEVQNGDLGSLPQPVVLPPPPPPTPTPPPPTPTEPVIPPTPEPPSPTPVPPTAAPTQPAPPTELPTATEQPLPTATEAPPPETPTATPVGSNGTLRLEDTDFVGGFRNAGASVYGGRTATWVYGQQSDFHTMRATWNLETTPPPGFAILVIEGMDSEDVAQTPMLIRLNDAVLWNAPSPFPNDDIPLETGNWGSLTLPFDAALLRTGENALTITNTAPGVVGLPPFIAIDYAVIQFP